MRMTSPTDTVVSTLAPVISGTMATFQGEEISPGAGNTLELWYNYGEGITLPTAPLQTPRQLVTTVVGTTLFPGFDVIKACTTFTYQVL